MPRKIIQSPLEGVAPTLNPTARPISIPIGATPAPNRSPLMELGEAFREFNPELRNMLRDASAREEHNAMALGELAAQKENAASRMGEIEGVLKQAVDAGQVSHVRLPAFERGFRSRVGKDLAQSLYQEKLTQRLPEAMRVDDRVDPEKIIAETYAQVSQQIHPEDFFARAAFDDVAQGVTAGFRQRAAEGYTAEYRRAAEQKIADEGSEIAFQLATASADDAPALRESVHAHLNQVRNELPKSKVNEFYVRNVVAPAIEKLKSEDKFTEARKLMDEMDNLDVTGKGGLLSQTSAAKAVFSNLRSEVERDARVHDNQAYELMKKKREAVSIAGEDAAAAQLQQLRLDNDGKLNPGDRFRLIDDFRKANAGEPLKVQGFTAAVHHEFDHEEKNRLDPRAVSDLEVSLKTLRKDDLEAGRARLDALYNANRIAPTDRTRLMNNIDKLESLYGAVDEGDYKRFKTDLFYARSEIGSIRTINFGDKNAPKGQGSVDFWEALPDHMKNELEQKVTQFFGDTLEAGLRAVGDPNRVPAEKAKVLDAATLKSQEYAFNLVREFNKRRIEEETQQKVAKQAQRIRSASINAGFAVRPSLGTGFEVPGKKANGVHVLPVSLDQRPGPETDEVDVRIPAASFKEWILPGAAGSSRVVNLPELAADIKENADEAKAMKSRDLYAYVKGRLGFTPEEVKNGITKHGVAFTPSAIDPNYITVFRNKAELEKHWNNGEPSELFLALGDTIDPSNKLTPDQFYLAQSALLTRR